MADKQNLVHCDIVSAEQALFSGEISFLSITGELGELGISPGHTPLLTSLKPGLAVFKLADDKEEVFYISGGYLEVQADRITVLADTVQRASDIDEQEVSKAHEEAQRAMEERDGEVDYSQVAAQLAETAAQLRALQELRNRGRA